MRSCLPRIATVLIPFSTALAGTTLYVPSPEYPTIQAAIDAAAPGDAVVLHDGVFQGAGNTDLLLGTKTLTLKSENGPGDCTIDCGHQVRGIHVVWGDSAETTIEGITIRDASLESGNGAGICCDEDSRVKVLECAITGCEAGDSDRGGGIFCAGGSRVSIRFGEISHCRAGVGGGGVYCEDGSNVEITACTIRDNETYEADGFGGHGGGLGMRTATVTVSDTDMVNNWAIGDGGAMTCDENSDARMIRCRFLRNAASGRGGGVCFWNGGSPEMRDCIVAGNVCWDTYAGGGGVYSQECTPAIDHCTIVSNRAVNAGGGVYGEGAGCPTVLSCIVWDNVGGSVFLENPCVDAVSFCDIEGGYEGFGNIHADPRFAGPGRESVYVDAAQAGDPAADGSPQHPYSSLQQAMGIEADMVLDYRLAFDSPCIGQAADKDNMGALRGTDGMVRPAGFTILVAPGVYSLLDCSFQRHVSLVGAGAGQTILEAPAYDDIRHVAGVCGLRTGALLKGVTVRGGGWYGVLIDTQQAPAIEDCLITQHAGAGVECVESSPVFTRCVISENTGYYGGGVRCREGGSPTFIDCTIRNNTADSGAGLLAQNWSRPVIRSCTIVENVATNRGGGVCCNWECEATIIDSEIRDNVGGNIGGGVLSWNSRITVSNCSITGNSALSGGGLGSTGASYGAAGEANVVNCVIAGNRATGGNGGGVICQGSAGLQLKNSLVAANLASDSGGGLACAQAEPVEVANCTVVGNSAVNRGGGIFSDCSPAGVVNSILWGSTAGHGPEIALARTCSQPPAGIVLAVVYCLVQGGEAGVDADPGCTQSWGESNRDSDPLFVSVAGQDGSPATWADNDYRLGVSSAAIDAGNNDLAPIDSTDLDHDGQRTEIIPFDLAGRPRRMDDPATPDVPGGGPPTVDMGAYEYFPMVRADFDGDGDVDGDDFESLRTCHTGPGVSSPAGGCADMDLDGDGDVDQSDFGLFQRCFSGKDVLVNPSCAS